MSELRARAELRRRDPAERLAAAVGDDQLVEIDTTATVTPPLIIRARLEHVGLNAWAAAHVATVGSLLRVHGAVLLRGFEIAGMQDFATFVRTIAGDPLEYNERSSPRTHLSDRVYTSTEYPAHQPIFLHNENSYAHTWPRLLFFWCAVAPAQAGETPLADCRTVYRTIPAHIRDEFTRRRVLYVRNFAEHLGLPWQLAFGTVDRSEVETRLHASGYQYQWIGADGLRTKRIGPAVARHPETHDLTWFNHATFFHISTLPGEMRDALLAQVDEADLPNQTFYGDGGAIEPGVLDTLRACYVGAKRAVPWLPGDVLLVDNILVAHGREAYAGAREIRVAMSNACSEAEIQ